MEDWVLVTTVPSFKAKNELYPNSTVYIDVNSIKIKDSEIVSFEYKQVYSRPFKNGVKTFKSLMDINCIKNHMKINSVIGYNKNNDVIAKETSKQSFVRIPEKDPLYGKTPIASSRDYVCMYHSKEFDYPSHIEKDKNIIDSKQRKLGKDLSNTDIDENKKEELSLLISVLRDYVQKNVKLLEESLKEINNYQIGEALQPTTLKSKTDIKNTKENIKKVANILKVSQMEYEENLGNEKLRNYLESKKFTNDLINSAIEGYEDSMQRNIRYFNQIYVLVNQTLYTIDEFLNFMLFNFNDYEVIGQNVYFNNEDNLRKFNNFNNQIYDNSQKLEKLSIEANDHANFMMGQMQKLEKNINK